MSGISRAVFADAKARATAALQNEQLTRQRVEALEQRIGILDNLLGRGFFGRLKWLVTGR